MAKIKLEPDALRVESFETAAAPSARGTVHARQEQPGDADEVGLLPVTDWKTCQGGDCTARTLCHYTCIEACFGADIGANRIG
ncbi:hypothetical protein [Longimicrobium sp.]|uniref:hypothetical protein n=1 Tax=Longimicrobium sp. TaxID=2029185 RepID=UPI002E3279FA|nr:hypothetical protein [Longimicrobium sp.]HEX6042354.1 hypothetical protein [Longimicrobium sp.]